ncbi:MAG: hypothetical protein AAF564_19030, partial [Bacteroidota bacterium]
GFMARMMPSKPDLSAKEAYAILHETGETLDDSPRIGRLINAREAVKAALGESTLATESATGREEAVSHREESTHQEVAGSENRF